MTPEAEARGDLFGVSGIPEVDFDAVEKVVGAGSTVINTYRPIVLSRMAVSSPVTITSTGYAGEGGGSCTATFKATEPISYTNMQAQFVVIEQKTPSYPWVEVEVATPVPVSLSAPGDSVVVTVDFDIAFVPVGDLQIVVFLENTTGPFVIVNSQLVPDPYAVAHVTTEYVEEIDAGGTATYSTVVSNAGTALDTITVSVVQDELPAGASPTDWEASFRELGGAWQTAPAQFVLNPEDTVELEVRMVDNIGTAEGMALTTLTSTSGGNPTRSAVSSFATFVETPSILLVADDMGWGNEAKWEEALAANGYYARTWVTEDLGSAGPQLSSYWAVLWTNANGNAFAFTGADEAAVEAYLDGGGNLFLASMNFLSSRLASTTLISDYFHVTSWLDDVGGLTVYGVPGDPISDGMEMSLYWMPPNSGDVMTIEAPAETIFTSSAGLQGIRVKENDFKVIFTTWPFEGINPAGAYPSNRETLLGRVLDWFAPDVGIDDGAVHRLAIDHVYPNPFNPVTKIAFTVPENAGRVTLTIHNVNGQVVDTLVDEKLEAGPADVVWNGTDAAGNGLATGVYFAKLESAAGSRVTKLTLLK